MVSYIMKHPVYYMLAKLLAETMFHNKGNAKRSIPGHPNICHWFDPWYQDSSPLIMINMPAEFDERCTQQFSLYHVHKVKMLCIERCTVKAIETLQYNEITEFIM